MLVFTWSWSALPWMLVLYGILCHLYRILYFVTGEPCRRSSPFPEKHADWWANLTSINAVDRRIDSWLALERSLSDRYVNFQGLLDECFGYLLTNCLISAEMISARAAFFWQTRRLQWALQRVYPPFSHFLLCNLNGLLISLYNIPWCQLKMK